MTQTPDTNHYRMVARNAGNLVVFVGGGANTEEHNGTWTVDSGCLPDDRDIATHLADQAELTDPPRHLAGVAQLAIARHGEPTVLGWIRQILMLSEDPVPHPVHESLAELPTKLRGAGYGDQYQLIVTSKYDAALEQAFRAAGEEYDVAIYRVPSAELSQPGGFVHIPYDGQPTPIGIGSASDYDKFPMATDLATTLVSLWQPIIVRINGVVADPIAYYQGWDGKFALTEDDYIGYLSGIPTDQVVPAQIRAKLLQANYLFLGYTLDDWRLRVFLQRIWKGPRLGRAKYWAVAKDPSDLDEQLWQQAGIELFRSGVREYLDGLSAFLSSKRGDT
jgi:hypothetical protein